MYKIFCATTILAGLTMLTGCGDNGDALMKQRIDEMNKLAEAIEDNAPKVDTEAILKRMSEADEKIAELSEERQEELQERFSEELAEAKKKLAKAMPSNPGKMMDHLLDHLLDRLMDVTKKNLQDRFGE